MDTPYYLDLLEKFKSVRIMAIGDIYLDEYVHGAVTEISLEAPIPVFEVHEKRYNPGASGNAACNAAALGGRVYMVGVVGADVNAGIIRREFEARNVDVSGLVEDPARSTNTYGKWRAGGHNIPSQEILRTDTPRPKMISGDVEGRVIEQIRALAPQVDAIMIGDQVSATISERVLDVILECASKYSLITVADSRARAGFFKGVTLVTPNDKEAGLAAGVEVTDQASLEQAGKFLLGRAQNVLITLGPDGIACFAADGRMEKVPIRPVAVRDVTGAGDTVTAAATLTLVAGGSLYDAAYLGNLAAGIAVTQTGVVTVANAEVCDALIEGDTPATDKVKTLEQLQALIKRLKREGKRVVWTNGCFDILHVGHIMYLQEARKEGDVMIVGLNSDASVKKNKGADRPVVSERDRAQVLSALECVDYIVIFDDKTPLPLLETLQPDIYAKGGDYTMDTIVQEERRLVESYGGRIAIIPGREGQSTTYIINKIAGKS
ncbi:MAG: Bifunctional protein HldE [Candidatus Hydrogenedentes bacterium ADurb.Bin101]|nr:MAG: Bifunctional protein HldE [Candidatus Hydrogenedentes bacterium ADurb.Bin101]HOH28500.1 D-glycero-beta-D-manno-heptose 1-phosphate adenylyltransferase [Candidatus Hydrogenedentota bacterium]